MNALTVAGHGRWLPLPLGADDLDAAATSAVAELLAGVAQPERVDDVIAIVAGTTRRVEEAAAGLQADGVFTLLAWLALPSPGAVVAGPAATLRAMPLDASSTLDEVVERLVGPEQVRSGPVDVERPGTGPSVLLRHRPVVGEGEDRQVSETRSAVWLLPEDEALLVLSVTTTDLVESAALDAPLRELAAGVSFG